MQGPLSGLLVQHYGHVPAFIVSAATCLVLAGAVLSLPVASRSPGALSPQRRSFAAEYRESATYIVRTPILTFVVAQAVVASLTGGAVDTLTIAYADRVLGVGAAGFRVILSAKSAGFVVGLTVLEPLRRRVPRPVLLPAALAFVGLSIVAFGLNHRYGVALFLAVLDGAGNSVASILSRVVFQDAVPDALRGKVYSANYMLFSAANVASTGVTGRLAEHVGLRAVFIASGMLLSAFGAWGRVWLRRRVAEEPLPASP